MFLDVGFDGKEILLNEVRGLQILIGLGIQPSTGPSSWGRTEVDKNWAIFFLGYSECLIYIISPIHTHLGLLGKPR
jgi:hypothetical protein